MSAIVFVNIVTLNNHYNCTSQLRTIQGIQYALFAE